jgi:alkanesulfonate monooxygenase
MRHGRPELTNWTSSKKSPARKCGVLYWVAKQIATFGHLYGRQVALNMLAGAFVNDLKELGDNTPRDRRYERMTEYPNIIMNLLHDKPSLNHQGEFYEVHGVKMKPPLSRHLLPPVLMSGSSDAGMLAAQELGAVAVRYPKPVSHYEEHPLEPGIRFGMRLGIIARENKGQAWSIAHQRFPVDHKGQLTHQLAMKTSDSVWHQELSKMKPEELVDGYPYWLMPFQNYKTFCPYLAGTYWEVAEIVARYIGLGFKTIITDIPPDKDELFHEKIAFELALHMSARASDAPTKLAEAARSSN